MSWYLFAYSRFAYSRFAYFRPKSGVSPTLNKIIFGHQSGVGVDFHQCLSQELMYVHLGGDEWTSTASGKDFFMAEDGQEEDRLIMFAMSKFNIVLFLHI